MKYYGQGSSRGEKVYIPLLKNQFAEQVSGGDVIYPLGVELLEIGFF